MEKGGGSRLLQMQAKFQQKQLQERELKIASLYEAQQARALDRVRHSPGSYTNGSNGTSSITSPTQQTTVAHQTGKVRQMFEERRTKGIDKSYPLQPIQNTEKSIRKTLPNGYSKVTNVTSNSRVATQKRLMKTVTTSSTHSVKKVHKAENIVNGSGDVNHNHEQNVNGLKQNMLPHSNGDLIPNIDETDKADSNYLLEDETFPDALAPSPTPRTPEPENNNRNRKTEEQKIEAKLDNERVSPEPVKMTNGVVTTKAEAPRINRKSPSRVKTSPAKTTIKSQPSTTSPRRVTSENTVSESVKARGAMNRTAQPIQKRHPQGSAGAHSAASKARMTTSPTAVNAGVACGVCGRHFAEDRIAKHQEICKKAHAKKRKPFDALKHRLAGTEAEPFINKLRKGNVNPSKTKVTSTTNSSSKQLNNNWRQKHEEFISAIRAAKQVQQHLNAGGKLSDLPPPPPSENPDYVQCPHCNRRFNQSAAARHIPKCASYQFNKPKPAAKKR